MGFTATRIIQAQQKPFHFSRQVAVSYVEPTCIGLHARFIIAKKKEEKEGVGKAMMGREVNSIATAREKCRQLL